MHGCQTFEATLETIKDFVVCVSHEVCKSAHMHRGFLTTVGCLNELRICLNLINQLANFSATYALGHERELLREAIAFSEADIDYTPELLKKLKQLKQIFVLSTTSSQTQDYDDGEPLWKNP